MNIDRTMVRTASVLVLLLHLAAPLFAAEVPVTVEAAGEAVRVERGPVKEVKDRAMQEALGNVAAKAVEAFLKADTPADNSRIADDLGYASVRGDVLSASIVREGWDEKDRNRYRVSIKALVRPVYARKSGGFSIKASLEKTDLKEGDEVKIVYQVNEDAYVYLFSVASNGSVAMLLPNAINQTNFATAGRNYEFPPAKSAIHISPKVPAGQDKPTAEEKIKVIAVKQNVDIALSGPRSGLFEIYYDRSGNMINELVQRLNKLDPAGWADETVVYRVKR